MSIVNIRCVEGCGAILGSVETSSTGGKFLGDAHYQFHCDSCALKQAVARREQSKTYDDTQLRFVKGEKITAEEQDLIYKRLFR